LLVSKASHNRIQVKIYGTLFLHSKERQVSTTSPELLEAKPDHYQGQNTTTINWRSHWQIEKSQILQQVGLNLGIQQCMNKRGRQIESSLFDK